MESELSLANCIPLHISHDADACFRIVGCTCLGGTFLAYIVYLLIFSPPLLPAHTHAHTRARMHTHTRTHTYTDTPFYVLELDQTTVIDTISGEMGYCNLLND